MTVRPSALEVLLIPALDAFSADLEAHREAITSYNEPARCACGFIGKATHADPRGNRSLGLHRAAAEKRASKAYDVAAEAIIARTVRLSSTEAAAIVDAHVAQLEAGAPAAPHRADPATFAKIGEAHAPATLELISEGLLVNPRARSYVEFLDDARAADQQAGAPVRFDPYA